MPKRTNAFQELVALIERSLAPRGARVTESALLSEDKREIDILIESQSGPYAIKVAVEAKNERRKMDVDRFGSIIAKYAKTSGVIVDKVVVVNTAGFTQKVHKRAKVEGILLLTLKEAMVADWAAAADQSLLYSVAPHVARIEFDPSIEHSLAPELANQARIVCTCCGTDHGTAMAWALKLLSNPDFAYSLMVEASRANGAVCRRAEWAIPDNLRIRSKTGDRPFSRLIAHFHCTVARGRLAVAAYRRGDNIIHHFSTSVAGRVVQFVIPNGPRSEQIAVSVSQAKRADSEPPPKSPPESVEAVDVESAAEPSPHAHDAYKAIQRAFASFAIRAEKSGTVHNFATGQDVCVDLLVCSYLTGKLRLCTALIFNDSRDSDAARLRTLVRRVLACDVDRVLVLHPHNDSRSVSDDGRLLEVGIKSFEADPVAQIVPGSLLWVWQVSACSATFWGNSPRMPNMRWDNWKIRCGERIIEVASFVSQLLFYIQDSAIGAFVDINAPRSVYGERELLFEFPTPKGAVITNGQQECDVRIVRGVARLNALATVFDKVDVVRAGSGKYQLSSSTGHFRAEVGGSSQTSNKIEVGGPDDQPRPYLGRYSLSSQLFRDFWSDEPNEFPSSNCPYNAGKIEFTDTPWNLTLLPLRKRLDVSIARGRPKPL